MKVLQFVLSKIVNYPFELKRENMIERELKPSQSSQIAKTTQDLPESEQQLSDIINALPVAVYTTDAQGRLTHFNKAAVEFSGRTPELGTDKWCVAWKLYHTDGTPMPHDTCPMFVALKEKRKITGEQAIAERPDGKRIWFEAHPVPLFDDEGNLTGGINMLVDITDRKKWEQQILQSEKELDDLFENATIGIHWVGPDGTILRANQAELDLLGYSREEYVGKSITDFHADQETIEDILTRLKSGEVLKDYEAPMVCKNGSIRHVVINSNVYEEDGKFIHTRCFTKDITEQKRTAQALQFSEKKYRSLFESMDEGFAIFEVEFDDQNQPVDCKILETNPGFEKHTGLADAEGRKLSELLPDLEQRWYDFYGNVALTGKPASVEDNTQALKRWYEERAFRVGKPHERKVAVIFNDVTERKNNEYANALLGAIVNGSEDAIVSKNLDSIITSWNPSAERLFGYTAEEAIGRSVTMLFPQDRLNEEDHILAKIKNGEKVEHLETVRVHKDGSTVDVSLTISPVKNSSGEVVGASKIARDISQIKRNREEREQLLLKEKTEREQLDEIFKNAPSFMCILKGPNHVFERANDHYYELTGKRKLIGKTVQEAIPEAAKHLVKMLDNAYHNAENVTAADMPVQLSRKPGGETETRYLTFVCQPIRNPDSTVKGVFIQGVDLTDRKRAEEKLQSVNENLEEKVKKRTAKLLSYQNQLRLLVSQLSKAEENERQRLATELHDNLGQILTIGKMKLDQYLAKNVADSEIRELSDLMNEAIRYTRELMSDLKPPPSLQQESFRKTINWLADKMDKYDLKISVEDDKQPKPLSKEVQATLTQCVRELLFNVVKHANVDEARVSLSRNKNKVQVVVEDKGAGFEQDGVNLTPTREGKFGLFNIMERINLMGGNLDIFSQPGEGTKAVIMVPADEKSSSDSATYEQAGSVLESEPKIKIKVLLVDDHLMMREGLRKIIDEEEDLTIVAEASSGEEAIDLTRKISPDVIVMDINMPGMNGIEATRKIHNENQQVRVIGLSLHNNTKVASAMKDAGASAYLTKTEATQELCKTIRNGF